MGSFGIVGWTTLLLATGESHGALWGKERRLNDKTGEDGDRRSNQQFSWCLIFSVSSVSGLLMRLGPGKSEIGINDIS